MKRAEPGDISSVTATVLIYVAVCDDFVLLLLFDRRGTPHLVRLKKRSQMIDDIAPGKLEVSTFFKRAHIYLLISVVRYDAEDDSYSSTLLHADHDLSSTIMLCPVMFSAAKSTKR